MGTLRLRYLVVRRWTGLALGLLLSAGAISLTRAAAGQETATASATYNQDVSPTLRKNCVVCHNPTGGAPFALQSYANARQWGEQMLEVTQKRYMPPWLPVQDEHAFKSERRLTDAELLSIRRWVSGGMIEGSGAATDSSYNSAELITHAGKPDLTLSATQTIHVPDSGPDVFTTIVVPVPAGAAHAVRAMAIEASDPQSAHAVMIGADTARTLRAAHPEVLDAGMPGMELSPEMAEKFAPAGQLLRWTPDAPVVTPEATWMLKGDSDLVLTLHAKTTGQAEDLKFKVLIYFAKAPGAGGARKLLYMDRDEGLSIAAGEREATVETQLQLKEATTVRAIYPRAHYAAQRMVAFATLPDGSQKSLLVIDKWDVDWDSVYRYVKPLLLPKGSVVHVRFVYDNSSNNPHNPSDPPKQIASGHSTKDEVAELWLETGAGR